MTYDNPEIDDPLWPYILTERLKPYMPYVNYWWKHLDLHKFYNTGITELNAPDAPGLCVRFTRTALRSPIKGVQAFPFVGTAYLQLANIRGGACKMVERVCMDGKLSISGYTIIEKHNLPSILSQGQWIAFVPTYILVDIEHNIGQWIYVTQPELSKLVNGIVPLSIKNKALGKI
jgi:hypothetical protein